MVEAEIEQLKMVEKKLTSSEARSAMLTTENTNLRAENAELKKKMEELEKLTEDIPPRVRVIDPGFTTGDSMT